MSGWIAGGAEVVRRPHDALAEMPLPDPIDHHARGQRVRRLGEPQGKVLSPTPDGCVGRRIAQVPTIAKDGRKGWCYLFSIASQVSPIQQIDIRIMENLLI